MRENFYLEESQFNKQWKSIAHAQIISITLVAR